MENAPEESSTGRLTRIGILAWLSMLGIDFLLHAGVLAGLYASASPFLLAPSEAFRRIPLGYLTFLLITVLLMWLLRGTGTTGMRGGFAFGLKLGLLTWGALLLGLASISTAPPQLLLGWWIGQSIELGVAGAVAGRGLEAGSLKKLTLGVIGLMIVCVILTVILQTTGLAPATKM